MASLIVPPLLSWYNETGVLAEGKQIQTLCNLPELIRYTASHLIRGQLIGAGVGIAFAVSGGGKKPYKQKGTGRPQVGSTRTPLWRHGGTVFGPQPRSYDYRLPLKVKRAGVVAHPLE